MPRRFVKASKRSARAISRVFEKGAKRVETLLGSTVTADKLADAVSGQWFDAMDAWMSLFGGGDGAPTEFIDAKLPGPGGAGGSLDVNRTATLDDQIAFSQLKTTPMTAPGSSDTLTMTLTAVPAGATDVEQILIKVNVPNATTLGLYRGFVYSAETIQVEVFVSVHN